MRSATSFRVIHHNRRPAFRPVYHLSRISSAVPAASTISSITFGRQTSYSTTNHPIQLTSAFTSLSRRDLHTTSPYNMSSDADYMSFLEKANQDTGSKSASTQSKSVGTKAVNTEVPKELQEVDEVFVSDADEPFEPVSLKWEGDKVPSESEFAELIHSKSEVSTVSDKDVDPRGQYKAVVEAVKKAGNDSVTFFRTQLDRSRVEYFVVSVDKKGSRLVGLKALAVES